MEAVWLVVPALVLAGFILWFFKKRRSSPKISGISEDKGEKEKVLSWKSVLGKSREKLSNLGIFRLKKIDKETLEELEEKLLTADVSYGTVEKLINELKDRAPQGPEVHEVFKEICEGLLITPPPLEVKSKPLVISIVGVNGVGKTTTVAKLSYYFKKMGKSVLIGQADTFRSAANDQLEIWAKRTESDFVKGREGADPASVVFDALSAAKARGRDVVIIDTAGRLHTKQPLMDQLKKIHRVMKKVIPEAPHYVFLVIDAVYGKNALKQSKVFSEALPISGVIMTKLDGSAKGGAILSIADELGLGVYFVGVGEKKEDFQFFDKRRFVEALFD